jgi:hypothetical protein
LIADLTEVPTDPTYANSFNNTRSILSDIAQTIGHYRHALLMHNKTKKAISLFPA